MKNFRELTAVTSAFILCWSPLLVLSLPHNRGWESFFPVFFAFLPIVFSFAAQASIQNSKQLEELKARVALLESRGADRL